MAARACPKCDGAMSEGLILTQDIHDGRYASLWMAGAPRSFWGSLDTKGKQIHPIVSWRCDACGFIENFAHDHEGRRAGA